MIWQDKTRLGFNHPYNLDMAWRGMKRHDATQKDKTRSLFQPYTYDQTRLGLIWLDRTRQDTPFNQHMVVTRWLVAAGLHLARPRTGVTNGGGQVFRDLVRCVMDHAPISIQTRLVGATFSLGRGPQGSEP
jgi:hypothetical protein